MNIVDPTNDSQLPVLLAPAALVLRRTQMTLGLLRDVVQESSAEHWYEQGKKSVTAEDWPDAIHAFRRCLDCDSNYWRATLQLSAALLIGITGPKEADPTLLTLQRIFKQPIPILPVLAAELPMASWERLNRYLGGHTGRLGVYSEVYCSSVYFHERIYALTFIQIILGELKGNTIDSLKHASERVQMQSLGPWIFPYPPEWMPYFMLSGFVFFTKAVRWWKKRGQYFREDSRRALSNYDICIELDKKNATAYVLRGFARFHFNDKYGAIEDLDEATKINPLYSAAYYIRGIVRYRYKEFNKAIEDYDLASKIDPTNALVYYRRSLVKKRLLDYTNALEDNNRAIEISPEDVRYYKGRAKVKDLMGDTAGAISDRMKASKLSIK